MWLTKKCYWKRNDKNARNRARKRIIKLMRQLQCDWNRASGQGFFIPKFHEQRHIPDDIERHGPPCGSHTGVTEHQHIDTKKETKCTQHIGNKLDKQTAIRIHETSVINAAMKEIEKHPSLQTNIMPIQIDTISNLNIYIPKRRSIGTLTFIRIPDGSYETKFVTSCKDFYLKDNVIQYLILLKLKKTFVSDTIYIFSEVCIKGILYKSHPCYHTIKNSWNDWGMIRYEIANADSKKPSMLDSGCKVWYPDSLTTKEKHRYAPGKILAFVSQQEVLDGTNQVINNNIVAIMHTCDFIHRKSSMFSTEWHTSYVYHDKKKKKQKRLETIFVTNIIRQCLMIRKNLLGSKYIEIWDTSLWPDAFLTDE